MRKEVIPVTGRMTPNAGLHSARADLISRSVGYERVECDFGASKGKFLSECAALHPRVFFVGLEGLSERVIRTNKKIKRLGLANAAIWRGWGRESLEELVPEEFLDTLHISFPDPWPKRRHWGRRLVTPEFLESAASRLKIHGVLRLMTDHPGYFESMKRNIAAQRCWIEVPWDDGIVRPVTEFETIFMDKGEPIGRLSVAKTAY